MDMEFKEEADSDEEALSPLSHLSLNEEGDDGDEAGAWDKDGDGGDGDNSQKISKKDALPLVIQWIKENYEASGNSCIPKHLVYQHYKDFCEDNNIQFTNMANFGKIIRSVFPRLKTRRLGPRGKTKHHYHGISISSASKLQVPADAIITGKKAQNRRVRGPDVTASPPKRQRRAHKLMEDGLDFPDYPEDGEQFMRRPIPALPSFDLEEIAFMGEVSDTLIQQLRHFMSLYKQHAQHLLSVLCSCSFTEVESLLVTFWSQNFGDFQEVFLREDIINHITSKDRLIYSLALDFFFPTLFEPQVKSLIESLIHLSQHIRAWMEKATQHFPPAFSARKLHEVKRFALNLRKRSRINLLAQQARECLEWSIMLVDWIGIEFDIIQDKTFMLFSSNASNSVPHNITATNLKGSALEVYNRRLDERLYRRAFVIENDLVEQKKKQAAAKEKKSKEEIQEEREISRAMQKFLQLQGKGEHEPFIDGLVQESLLRKRIMQLQEWRKMGIKTLIEGEVYEKEKARREAEKGRMTRGVANSIYAMERTGVRGSKWINRHNAIPWDLLTDDKDKKKGKLTRKQAPLDLTGAPKLECLSLKERELCGALRLYPQQYVLIKETLIRELLRHGGQVPKALARKLINIDDDVGADTPISGQ